MTQVEYIIREGRGGTFTVEVRDPKRPVRRVEGFSSEGEARIWIKRQTSPGEGQR